MFKLSTHVIYSLASPSSLYRYKVTGRKLEYRAELSSNFESQVLETSVLLDAFQSVCINEVFKQLSPRINTFGTKYCREIKEINNTVENLHTNHTLLSLILEKHLSVWSGQEQEVIRIYIYEYTLYTEYIRIYVYKSDKTEKQIHRNQHQIRNSQNITETN